MRDNLEFVKSQATHKASAALGAPPANGSAIPSGDSVAPPTEVISHDIYSHWAQAMVCRLRAANTYHAQQAMLEMDAIAIRLFK